MDDPSTDPRVGSVLQERYRILERLAVGSMGIVYRAERLLLGRPLAVKFLHASYAADPTFIQRFERETRVMGRLAHPHCVSVIDFGVDGGPYVVMEFVDGRTLRSLVEGGRLTVERAALITRQILAGLAHAHELGIIHRDIKPANIMMMDATGTGDHVRILDFGLATLREAHSADISHSAIVIGTPNYMSPEQSVGGKADVRSDVYSTGVVLFELLTGRKPFTSDDTFELLSMHRSAPIPKLASVVPDVHFPPGLQAVIDRALAKSPDDRFQSAMDFKGALEKALEQREPPARRARHATRPVPSDDRDGRESRAAREAREVHEDEADYRQSLGVARSGAMRAPRPRRRRRRPGLFAAVIALAVVGGAAWGGYAVWHSEIGARLRAIIERPPPRATRGASATPAASAPEASEPSTADEATDHTSGGAGPAQPPTDEAAGAVAPETERGSSAGAKREEPAATPGAGGSGERESSKGAERTEAPPAGDDGAGGAAAATEGHAAGARAGEQAAGQGGADEIPAEPQLPAEEREEPVAPVGDDTATVDSAEPESAAAIRQPAAGDAPQVDNIPGAVALIKSGKREDAIRALIELRRDQPRSAYVPYLLGNLYFGKGWWTLGMDYYDAAIRSNELYAGKQILNQNLIRALGSKKTRKKAARMFVNSIGRQSLPFLRQAARADRDPMVRDWSGWLVWRLTQLSRKRANH
jgi:eukaryotic-like serine/threonine-protein kinase